MTERVLRFADGSAVVFNLNAMTCALAGMEAGAEPSLEIVLQGAVVLAPGHLRLFRYRLWREIRLEMHRCGLWEAQGSDP
jgi:hypothetical protein